MRIVLDHINRRFREPVLKDISYTFEGGKLYVIKGISGCGKTTLLNILGGLDVLYEGSFSSEAAESARPRQRTRESMKQTSFFMTVSFLNKWRINIRPCG